MRPFDQIKSIIKDFGTDEMHERFLRLKETDLPEHEQKIIENWIGNSPVRKILYHKYKEAIEFEKQVSKTEGSEIYKITDDLKNAFPKTFSGISNEVPPKLLKDALTATLRQMSWEFSREIVYGKRRITIIAYVVRALLLIITILIIIQLFKTVK